MSDVPGFGVLGTRINIDLNTETQERWRFGKWQFLSKWCNNAGYSKLSAKTVRAPATRGVQSQAALVSAHRIETSEQSNLSLMEPLFGVLKTSISGFVAVGLHCALLKTCCRIGGRNHHSRHRAMIVCDTCTQRSAIVFLTPGQLAGQMRTPRIKEHMHTEKTCFQHQIWPQKGVTFRTYNLLFPSLVLGAADWSAKRGLATQSFSPFALSFAAQYLVSMAAAATILCLPDRLHHQNVYLLKVSLRNHNHMRSIQLLRLQAYRHCL